MLANAVAWVGGEVGGGGALHMLCQISLLPLLVSTFACNFFKLKRASRSHAKTGLFSCLLGFFLVFVLMLFLEGSLEGFGRPRVPFGAHLGSLLVTFGWLMGLVKIMVLLW